MRKNWFDDVMFAIGKFIMDGIEGLMMTLDDIYDFLFIKKLKNMRGEEVQTSAFQWYKSKAHAYYLTIKWKIARFVLGETMLSGMADICPYCNELVWCFVEGKKLHGQYPISHPIKVTTPAPYLIPMSFKDIDLGLTIIRAGDPAHGNNLWVVEKDGKALKKNMEWVTLEEMKDCATGVAFSSEELTDLLTIMRGKK